LAQSLTFEIRGVCLAAWARTDGSRSKSLSRPMGSRAPGVWHCGQQSRGRLPGPLDFVGGPWRWRTVWSGFNPPCSVRTAASLRSAFAIRNRPQLEALGDRPCRPPL